MKRGDNMRDKLKEYEKRIKKKNKKTVKAVTIISTLAVVALVMYSLITPGIAMVNTPHCGIENHTHTEACYSDPTADVETEDTWKRSFVSASLGDNWCDNVAAIAKTQLGYKESERNYHVTEDNEQKGYTRYGEWSGDCYSDWNTIFAEFCIHYANVDENVFPMNADIDEWIQQLQDDELYEDAASADYQAGDLVFLQKENQETAKQVGIITKLSEKNGKSCISVIEGNCENQVKENEYSVDDSNILGYGLICKVQMRYKASQMNVASVQSADTEDTYSSEESGQAVAAQGIKTIDLA